jgi:hypothetical protein
MVVKVLSVVQGFHCRGSSGLFRKGFCGTCKGSLGCLRQDRLRLVGFPISRRSRQVKIGQNPRWSSRRIRCSLRRIPIYAIQNDDLWHKPWKLRSAFDGGGDLKELSERSSHPKLSKASPALGLPEGAMMAGRRQDAIRCRTDAGVRTRSSQVCTGGEVGEQCYL